MLHNITYCMTCSKCEKFINQIYVNHEYPDYNEVIGITLKCEAGHETSRKYYPAHALSRKERVRIAIKESNMGATDKAFVLELFDDEI